MSGRYFKDTALIFRHLSADAIDFVNWRPKDTIV